MKTASVTKAKNQLSALLDQVKQGQSVLILDRNMPVARLEPVAALEGVWPAQAVEALEREGLVRRPQKRLSHAFYATDTPLPKPKSSVLEALLEERREGR